MTNAHQIQPIRVFKLIQIGLLPVTILTFSLLTGCQRSHLPLIGQPEPAGPVRIDIDNALLEKADLNQLWAIPKLGPEDVTLKQIHYNQGRLFVVSSTNQLYVLDGLTGHLIGSSKLASEASYCSEPSFYQDHILYVIGNEIVELKQKDGERVETIPLSFVASTNAVRTHNSYFVGSTDGRLYCMDPVDKIDIWNSVQPKAPVGNLQITDLKLDSQQSPASESPLIKEEDLPHNLVYFTCKDNKVYASWADTRRLVWDAPASGPVAGVVLSEDCVFAPSEDTSLRCYNAKTGDLLWKYLSGGKLISVPKVTERYIYQRIEQKSLICLLKRPMTKYGKLKWELDNGLALIAENGQLSYVVTNDQELVCMDNATGKTKLSFYIPQADLFVSNTQDTLIFLANHSGSIVALQPAE